MAGAGAGDGDDDDDSDNGGDGVYISYVFVAVHRSSRYRRLDKGDITRPISFKMFEHSSWR